MCGIPFTESSLQMLSAESDHLASPPSRQVTELLREMSSNILPVSTDEDAMSVCRFPAVFDVVCIQCYQHPPALCAIVSLHSCLVLTQANILFSADIVWYLGVHDYISWQMLRYTKLKSICTVLFFQNDRMNAYGMQRHA